jgi:endo-beta-N-acetylglucosaminidase D
MKSAYCLLLALLSIDSFAAIKDSEPPFALTLEQTRNWSEKSPLANADNVSKVPLAKRFIAPLDEGQAGLDKQAKVLYVPDGMNNFANYLETQGQFNLYNFTHWSQIDLLNWFAGTADHTVQIPARPWVDTAHKNGVKVIGSIFLAVARYGGNPHTVEALLSQDQQGHFVFADKLIEIASYYGFDGWLINQETDLTAVKDERNELLEGQVNPEHGKLLAAKLLAFMQYLTAKAPEGMEIHWYDAMVSSGQVHWQNELNSENQNYLQADVASADGIFINYWWDRAMVKSSQQLAIDLQRSPYDVYFGVDLWPSRNAQRAFSRTEWLADLFSEDGTKALTSIALFAPNFNYNFDGETHTPAFSSFAKDATDYRSFYQTEQRLFSGDDLNIAIPDDIGWQGLSSYLPAKSSITSLPMVTHFNTGQGNVWMHQGLKVSGPWTNMSLQDVLPTWQFAVQGNNRVSVFYDFEQAFEGGSSLGITADLSEGRADIPLYATDVILGEKSHISLSLKGDASPLSVTLISSQGQSLHFALTAQTEKTANLNGWYNYHLDLSHLAGRRISQLSLSLSQQANKAYSVQLGRLEFN